MVHSEAERRSDNVPLFAIAGLIALLHLLTNGRYGFHRDELQFLSDARHLDWGFVPYPPLTAFVERIGLNIFGLSLVGLRLFSVIAQAVVIFVAGLMAREFGGSRLAQVTAACAVALSPLPLFQGTEFQYSSFDLLWWVLVGYFALRLLNSEDQRWWVAIGAVLGLGLMTKYTIVVLIAGLILGFVATNARRLLLTPGFVAGVALALLIFLPNLLWQTHHDWITFHFLQSIHARDVSEQRADGFIRDQFLLNANLFAIPLWIAGLVRLLRSPRYRALAFLYLVPFAALYFGKGRFYYLAPAYPLLIAVGAAEGGRWVERLGRRSAIAVEAVLFAGIALSGALACAVLIPLASSGPLKAFALKNNGDLREEIGWEELVRSVAGVRDSLPLDEQQNLGVVVANYGEQGAIEMFGPQYGLPLPISTTNSAWLRGYPTPQPTTLVVIGRSQRSAEAAFTNCRLAAHTGNSEGVQNEESRDHPDIFVCGPPRQPWAEFWRDHRNFG